MSSRSTEVAIRLLLRENPNLNHKELATILHIGVRRVQQVMSKLQRLVMK